MKEPNFKIPADIQVSRKSCLYWGSEDAILNLVNECKEWNFRERGGEIEGTRKNVEGWG